MAKRVPLPSSSDPALLAELRGEAPVGPPLPPQAAVGAAVDPVSALMQAQTLIDQVVQQLGASEIEPAGPEAEV